MNTQQVKLAQISVNNVNPRTIKEEKFNKLVTSILVLPKMFELRPIVVDNTMTALGGNMRYRALCAIVDIDEHDIRTRLNASKDYQAKTQAERDALVDYWLAWKNNPTAPVINASNLSDAEKREFIIKDNVSFGDWDYDALANEWEADDLNDWGVGVWEEKNDDNTRLELSTANGEKDNAYNAFEDKFKPKLTTDDCYTPQPVYDAVLAWVKENVCDLNGLKIERPFKPNGDYQNHPYAPNSVVIDNPPFSILSEICRFYAQKNIPFFIFAPTLSLFTAPDADLTYIVTPAAIIYENGASVNTSFITNMVDDVRIWVSADLTDKLNAAQPKETAELAKLKYPDNVITSATVSKYGRRGINFKIPKDECECTNKLDNLKAIGKALFGNAFYISDRCAEMKNRAEIEAANRAEIEAANRAEIEAANRAEIELSEREREIIKRLNKNTNNLNE